MARTTIAAPSMPSASLMVALAMPLLSAAAQDNTASAAKEVLPLADTYADIAFHTYSDALHKAKALAKSVDTFLATPTQLNLIFTRTRWIEARLPYLQSEVFRFSGGPIDDDAGPEALLNGWPVNPAHIDYSLGDKGRINGGIVNDPSNYPQITKALIASLNRKDGSRDITTGYHVIEFLLWGEDLKAGGAGARSFSDYGESAENSERRGAYLKAAMTLLVDHLQAMVDAWDPA